MPGGAVPVEARAGAENIARARLSAFSAPPLCSSPVPIGTLPSNLTGPLGANPPSDGSIVIQSEMGAETCGGGGSRYSFTLPSMPLLNSAAFAGGASRASTMRGIFAHRVAKPGRARSAPRHAISRWSIPSQSQVSPGFGATSSIVLRSGARRIAFMRPFDSISLRCLISSRASASRFSSATAWRFKRSTRLLSEAIRER